MRSLSGFYTVEDDSGVCVCRARGRFRYESLCPLVGDEVHFSVSGEGRGTIEEILPRRNFFNRPAVSNLDQLVLVASRATPVTDPFLLDRMTALAAYRGCACVICVNKCDLVEGGALSDIYRSVGLPVVETSAATGQGLDTLRELLAGKVSAFTGNSGVGKSSLLNALEPTLGQKTGEVSEKLGRGRHTTRQVELFRLYSGALVVDTPGFSSFDMEHLEEMRAEELPRSFQEFRPFLGRCRYLDCSHTKERGCAVRQAVRDGSVPQSRYESFVRLMTQLLAVPDWERERKKTRGTGARNTPNPE